MSTALPLKLMLEEIRQRFESVRRAGADFQDDYHSCKKKVGFLGKVFGSDTRFDQFYTDQQEIYQKGKIVWGTIIQANSLLFEPGPDDCPAAFMYSLDERMDDHVDILLSAAHGLFDIKGEETDQDLQEFSEKLADEMVADWKIPIPKRLTHGLQCYYATNMIFRKHIANRYLSGPFFPMLVAPVISDVAFILPEKYWGSRFKAEVWPG